MSEQAESEWTVILYDNIRIMYFPVDVSGKGSKEQVEANIE